MNRRTFIQSIAAALSLTAVGAKIEIAKPKIRYELFANDFMSHRYDLGSPFEINDQIYATDARILITHAGGDCGSLVKEGRFPDVSRLMWSEFDEGGFKPLGKPNYSPWEDWKFPHTWCPDCMGTGRIGNNIQRCVDERCGCAYERCPTCGDSGWMGGVKCQRCDCGTIRNELFDEVIDGGRFMPGYGARLRTLGDLDVKALPWDTDNGEKCSVLLFRNDHVKGFLMGLYR